MKAPQEIAGRDVASAKQFLDEVVGRCQPVVLRGLVCDWPVTQMGIRSPAALQDYLSQFATDGAIEVFLGDPRIAGKYFYSDDLKGFNFERRRMRFADALQAIVSSVGQSNAATMYLGSIPTEDFLPGFAAQNKTAILDAAIGGRIWLGHAANVSCHYDAFENLACVIAGSRRFTLYEPQSISRLYVGPVDNTMAGQPVSLAASMPSDLERFPLFQQIQQEAWVADLAPGDALFLPKLWWHKVESTAPFNGLVNYWWDAFSAGPDAPYTSLLLSMITLAERPYEERQAWKAYFDHYVFRTAGHPLAHLPADQHGLLGPLKPDNYKRLRARIMHLLRGG